MANAAQPEKTIRWGWRAETRRCQCTRGGLRVCTRGCSTAKGWTIARRCCQECLVLWEVRNGRVMKARDGRGGRVSWRPDTHRYGAQVPAPWCPVSARRSLLVAVVSSGWPFTLSSPQHFSRLLLTKARAQGPPGATGLPRRDKAALTRPVRARICLDPAARSPS